MEIKKEILDRTGMVFGALTLKKHLGGQFYECICDCGNSKKVEFFSLSSGRQVSCGCKKKKQKTDFSKQNEKYVNVINGRLKFIEFVGRQKAKWQCDCGTIKIINPYNVMNKNPKKAVYSCGCLAKEVQKTLIPPASFLNKEAATADAIQMIGQKFGNLTVISTNEKSGSTVNAMCSCGKISNYNKASLKTGHTKSCGCLSQESRMNTNLKKYGTRSITTKISKAEIEIREFIESMGINNIEHGCLKGTNGKNVEFDILCHDNKIAIEHNGVMYHHDRINGRQSRNYHINKTNVAKENGYRLIHIMSFEWSEKKDQVKSFLRSAFSKNKNRVFARKTEVKKIGVLEAKTFLRKYHILGFKPGMMHVGLFLKNDLLAVATVSKHHINNKDIELSRWCGKDGTTVSGGLGKVMKFLLSEINRSGIECDKIVSWADRRWSEGSGYLSAGWTIDKILPPDYFYIDSKNLNGVIYKYRRRKSKVGTPEGMTEKEHSIYDGLLRIWDCGKIRLIYRLKDNSPTSAYKI